MEILETVGFQCDHTDAIEALRHRGARVDGSRVRLPRPLVESALDSAPAQITLPARDPQYDVELGCGRVHFTNGFGATFIQDPLEGTSQPATLQDLVRFTRLADALENVHYVLFSVVPQDIPARLLDPVCTATVLQNTRKHVQLSLETAEWLEEVVEIGRMLVEPGRPLPFSAGGVPNSPLHYTQDVIAKFMRLAQLNIPCFIVVGAMAGATAPVTLAGALAQQQAEFLAGVAIHQAANPGAPVAYGTFSGAFDMRHTKLIGAGPEAALLTAATQQLANMCGVPVGYATGGIADSPSSDVQAGAEKVFSIFSAALAGVDVIHDAVSGLLGTGMAASLAQMMIDNEICATAAYYLQGIPCDRDSIAAGLIAAVGPGGSYLTEEHTAHNFRQALYMTKLRARNSDPSLPPPTRSGYLEQAAAQAETLLQRHQPPAISVEQAESIATVLEVCQKKLIANAREL
jgi:trimethylamine--corrinoid protein Co-methyltransferase